MDNGILTFSESVSCHELNNINKLQFIDSALTRGETLFVCADNGIGYYDAKGELINIDTGDFNSSIDHMTADYQGNLWFTSSRLGLLRLSRSSFTQLKYVQNTESSVVNSVCKWNGRYYIGTDSGLAVTLAEGSENVNVGIETQNIDSSVNELVNELDNVRIRCITTDSNNNMWICTTGSGVYELTYSGEIIKYDKDNGLNGNRYRTITELSDNTMLAAGDSGLSFIKMKVSSII